MSAQKKKVIILIAVALLLAAAAAAGICVFFALQKSKGVHCLPSSFDFGAIPLTKNVAIGTREFEIVNVTDKEFGIARPVVSCDCVEVKLSEKTIPAGGRIKGILKVHLQQDEIHLRHFEVAFLPVEKSVEPVRMNFTARAAFSPFAEPDSLNFQILSPRDRREAEIYINNPSENRILRSVKSIELVKPNERVTIEQQEVSDKTSEVEGGKTFHLNLTHLKISLQTRKDDSATSYYEEILVKFHDDRELRIPVIWELRRKPIFVPSETRYFLPFHKVGESVEFQIFYNPDAGGKIKAIRMTNSEIIIKGCHSLGDLISIQLQYSPKSQSGSKPKPGDLIVETEDGREHKLEIIAS